MDIGFVSWGLVADYSHLVLSPGSIMVRAKAGESMTSGIHCCPIFFKFILRDRPLYCEEYVYTGYIHICVHRVYTHMCTQDIYTYLTAWRLYMDCRCFKIILRVTHFSQIGICVAWISVTGTTKKKA